MAMHEVFTDELHIHFFWKNFFKTKLISTLIFMLWWLPSLWQMRTSRGSLTNGNATWDKYVVIKKDKPKAKTPSEKKTLIVQMKSSNYTFPASYVLVLQISHTKFKQQQWLKPRSTCLVAECGDYNTHTIMIYMHTKQPSILILAWDPTTHLSHLPGMWVSPSLRSCLPQVSEGETCHNIPWSYNSPWSSSLHSRFSHSPQHS